MKVINASTLYYKLLWTYYELENKLEFSNDLTIKYSTFLAIFCSKEINVSTTRTTVR